jgi:hypothetical protein
MIAHTPVEVYRPVEQRFWKRILIVDDDKDITITFKAGIEESNNHRDAKRRIEVYTYNNPDKACQNSNQISMTFFWLTSKCPI